MKRGAQGDPLGEKDYKPTPRGERKVPHVPTICTTEETATYTPSISSLLPPIDVPLVIILHPVHPSISTLHPQGILHSSLPKQEAAPHILHHCVSPQVVNWRPWLEGGGKERDIGLFLP